MLVARQGPVAPSQPDCTVTGSKWSVLARSCPPEKDKPSAGETKNPGARKDVGLDRKSSVAKALRLPPLRVRVLQARNAGENLWR